MEETNPRSALSSKLSQEWLVLQKPSEDFFSLIQTFDWDPVGMRANLAWNWQQTPDEMLDYLGELISDNLGAQIDAAGYIADLQSHNPPVKNAYLHCHRYSADLFWTFVVEASYQEASLDGCRINIDWQWHNKRESIKDAQGAYTGFKPFRNALGMYYLMDGQKHNYVVMEGYRAAYREDPSGLWAIVNSYV